MIGLKRSKTRQRKQSSGLGACFGLLVVMVLLYVQFSNKFVIFSVHTIDTPLDIDNDMVIPPNTSKLPLTIGFRFIFVMGLEGTGHRFMNQLFDSIRRNKKNILSKYFVDRPHSFSQFTTPICTRDGPSTFDQGFILESDGKHSLYYGLKADILYMLKQKPEMLNIIETIAHARNSSSKFGNKLELNDHVSYKYNYDYNPWPLIIMPKQKPSYPFCTVKKKMNPNIIELFLLLKSIENEINNNIHFVNKSKYIIQFDLSVIVMYRSFINSLYSSCSRFGGCKLRFESARDNSLPMMMRQMYFFIKYINNHNHTYNNRIKFDQRPWNYISNITKYRDYNDLNYYGKQLNNAIEQEFFNLLNYYKDINIDSAIKVLYYDRMLEYTNKSQVMPLANNLLQLFGIETTEKNVAAMGNSIFYTLHRLETSNDGDHDDKNKNKHKHDQHETPDKDAIGSGFIRNIKYHGRGGNDKSKNKNRKKNREGHTKINSVGVSVTKKWEVIRRFVKEDKIIKGFYAKSAKDKTKIVSDSQTFHSKLWTLFYIPQLALN